MAETEEEREALRQYKLRRQRFVALNFGTTPSLNPGEVENPSRLAIDGCHMFSLLAAECREVWKVALELEPKIGSRLRQVELDELEEALRKAESASSRVADKIWAKCDPKKPFAKAIRKVQTVEELLTVTVRRVELEYLELMKKRETSTRSKELRSDLAVLHSLDCLLEYYERHEKFLSVFYDFFNAEATTKAEATDYFANQYLSAMPTSIKAAQLLHAKFKTLRQMATEMETEGETKVEQWEQPTTSTWEDWKRERDEEEKEMKANAESIFYETPTLLKFARQSGELLGFLDEIGKATLSLFNFAVDIENRICRRLSHRRIEKMRDSLKELDAKNNALASNVHLLVEEGEAKEPKQRLKELTVDLLNQIGGLEKQLKVLYKLTRILYNEYKTRARSATSQTDVHCECLISESLIFLGRQLSHSRWIAELIRRFTLDENAADSLISIDIKVNQQLKFLFNFLTLLRDKETRYNMAVDEIKAHRTHVPK